MYVWFVVGHHHKPLVVEEVVPAGADGVYRGQKFQLPRRIESLGCLQVSRPTLNYGSCSILLNLCEDVTQSTQPTSISEKFCREPYYVGLQSTWTCNDLLDIKEFLHMYVIEVVDFALCAKLLEV